MITFKDFLTEARMAPLYHATSAVRAIGILEYDLMKAGESTEPGLNKRTVSLTRNFIFARNWLDEGAWDSGKGVIFEIDQLKLTQRHKIVPYSYFGTKEVGYLKNARRFPGRNTFSKGKGADFHFDNQFEEAVIGNIKNFTQYVTKIWISPMTPSKVVDLANGYKIPVEHLPT